MYTLDDPLLALLLRFVGSSQKASFRDHDFYQRQLAAIREHVGKYPPEERRARAMEWVEKYARKYREAWMKQIVDDVSGQRCPDCPLAEIDADGNCQIHDLWLQLLQQYVAEEIDDRIYVESTLALLARHKEDLKLKSGVLEETA